MKGFSFVHPPISLAGNGLLGGPIGHDVGPLYAGASRRSGGVELRSTMGFEKLILYAALDRCHHLVNARLNARHNSSLTPTLCVPIVRRHRRRSVEAPKLRQLDSDGFRSFRWFPVL